MRKFALLAATVAVLALGQVAEARGCRGGTSATGRGRLFARSRSCGCATAAQSMATYTVASPTPAGDCPSFPLRQ